jgi:TolA-binding protein
MEKKVAGGNIAIALGILCIVFVIALVGTIASYTSVINSKDATRQDYVSTHTHSNDEFNNYGSQIASLQNQMSSLNTQVNSLNSRMISLQAEYDSYVADHHHTDQEFDSITAPNLIAVDLKASDLGAGLPWIGTPVLHVYGYVCNVGAYAAYNSKIHVVAHQSGGVEAINTYIALGTLYGQSWTTVDSSFTYSGEPLLDWTITPQWTAAP